MGGPPHSRNRSTGRICLWSPTDKLLFSGDHLLPAVTPPVTFERGFDRDPLRSDPASLKLVAERDPTLARDAADTAAHSRWPASALEGPSLTLNNAGSTPSTR